MKVKQLQAENEKLLSNIQLHSGDICSLNNEVSMLVNKNDELEAKLECTIIDKEKRIEQLQAENEDLKARILSMLQYCPKGIRANYWVSNGKLMKGKE